MSAPNFVNGGGETLKIDWLAFCGKEVTTRRSKPTFEAALLKYNNLTEYGAV